MGIDRRRAGYIGTLARWLSEWHGGQGRRTGMPLGAHADHVAWAILLLCMKLLLVAARSGSQKDWARWSAKIVRLWEDCTPHEQRLALASAMAWFADADDRHRLNDILITQTWVVGHTQDSRDADERARVACAPFPAVAIGPTMGAESRM